MAEIPILLLKTRTHPHDGYEEYFSASQKSLNASEGETRFKPIFVPVLEHTANTENLGRLEEYLRNGEWKERYGGMVFTSQRAVEGWRSVVERVEGRIESGMVRLLFSLPSAASLLVVVIKRFRVSLCSEHEFSPKSQLILAL